MIDLLQITDTLQQATNLANKNHATPSGLFDLLVMGGWIMIPLAIMMLYAVYIFTERTLAIRNAARQAPG